MSVAARLKWVGADYLIAWVGSYLEECDKSAPWLAVIIDGAAPLKRTFSLQSAMVAQVADTRPPFGIQSATQHLDTSIDGRKSRCQRGMAH
jgi:hypothetical protein